MLCKESEYRPKHVTDGTYALVQRSVFRCVAPDHGNSADSRRSFKFVDILVDKRLALRIPCHPNFLGLWRSLRALHCRNENVADFLCLEIRLLLRGKMRVINLGIFLSSAALKFSRRVPNEHRLRLYTAAQRVLTPAKDYPGFRGIYAFKEISGGIDSLAVGRLSQACRGAGDDDRSDEYCENCALHEKWRYRNQTN